MDLEAGHRRETLTRASTLICPTKFGDSITGTRLAILQLPMPIGMSQQELSMCH